MKNQVLQYYMHDGPTAFRFELTGHLDREAARSLDQDWRTASSTIGDRRLIVDITFVTDADEQGRALLTRWHREGAQIIAKSRASLALAESILGKHFREGSSETSAAAGSLNTRFPLHASSLVKAVTVFLLAAIVFPVEAKAAPSSFLWTLENTERKEKVRRGETVVGRLEQVHWFRGP